MFETLIKFLSDKIRNNSVADFANVYPYEVEQFEGDPIAIIVPSSNDSDYFTNKENARTYAFNLTIFVSRVKRDKDAAEKLLRELVSSIIDGFDKDYTLSGMPAVTGYTFINVFATPSSWGYLGAESEYRVAEINLKCKVLIDVNLI